MTTATTPTPTRLGALDGLRGVAAVVVVLWHALLTTRIPEFVPNLLGSTDSASAPTAGSVAWWLFDTPLRLLTMGINAVSVFFVLSGFVLAIPVFRGRSLNLWSYFPRRVLRLWLPSAAAVLLAVIVIATTGQDPKQAESAWGAEFSVTSLNPTTILRSFFLITGTNDYNNPLWSLKWEMLFSLFLPVALVIGLTVRDARVLWSAVAATALISGYGDSMQVSALQYASMFLVGVFVARIVAQRTGVPRPRRSWTTAILGVALIAVPDAYRTLADGDMHGPFGRLLSACVVLGAALLVYALTIPSGLTRVFASRPVHALGRISFSLYLVHAPLLLAGVHVFGDASLALTLTVPLSFVIAGVFTRWVEEPSARLARAAGDRAAALMSDVSATPSSGRRRDAPARSRRR